MKKKTVLVHLLAGKEQQKKTVSESAITMVESQVHKKSYLLNHIKQNEYKNGKKINNLRLNNIQNKLSN